MDTGKADEKTPQGAPAKKLYVKPAFVWERAFETMALACGKVIATQGTCHQVRKNS